MSFYGFRLGFFITVCAVLFKPGWILINRRLTWRQCSIFCEIASIAFICSARFCFKRAWMCAWACILSMCVCMFVCLCGRHLGV